MWVESNLCVILERTNKSMGGDISILGNNWLADRKLAIGTGL